VELVELVELMAMSVSRAKVSLYRGRGREREGVGFRDWEVRDEYIISIARYISSFSTADLRVMVRA